MQNLALVILSVGLAAAIFALLRKKEEKRDDSGFLLLQNQFNEMSRNLSELSKIMNVELTRVGEGQKQVMNFTEQLRDLQEILKNPKQRGILGEYYLETLLKNVLPTGSYQMQYPFADGTIVDAVVFVKDKIIPIDSKFSLENYNRLAEVREQAEKERLAKVFENDLKNRIVETSKYVKPEEGTLEFAFMFIPHEAIYYDLLINKVGDDNLIQRAFSKYKVIIVSPTSFLAYLQTVLQGLKALQIEESAKQIRANVENLQKHIKSYEDYHARLGSALGTVVNHYNNSSKEYQKIDKDVLRITGEKMGLDLPAIDKPETGV